MSRQLVAMPLDVSVKRIPERVKQSRYVLGVDGTVLQAGIHPVGKDPTWNKRRWRRRIPVRASFLSLLLDCHGVSSSLSHSLPNTILHFTVSTETAESISQELILMKPGVK